jgi:hypothetical protein
VLLRDELSDLRFEPDLLAECDDLGAHVLDHRDEAERADVRLDT